MPGAAQEEEHQLIKASSVPDIRLGWICQRACSSLKTKEEAFQRLLASEARAPVQKFVEDSDTVRLFIYADGNELGAATKPPQKYKKKAVFFLKQSRVALTAENLNSIVTHGDLGEAPLETLSLLSQEVLLPVLSNPANQAGWPEVIAKDVTDTLHKFLSEAFIAIGHSKGQTLLQLLGSENLPPPSSLAPPSDDGKAGPNKDLVHNLEISVVFWARQIKDVLKADPDTPSKKNEPHPGPLRELDFWEARAARLNSLHDQLNGDKIRKVARILELARSSYYPAFTRLTKEVEAARGQASSNVRFLRPLRKLLEKLNMMDDFPLLPDLFRPIMHTLLLIWSNSPHFNVAARLVSIVRAIGNDVIMQACKFCVGSEVLQMDPAEAVEKLRVVLRITSSLKDVYQAYSARSVTQTPNNPWRFHTTAIFGRVDAFSKRCTALLDFCQTCLQFSRLERIEIGGTRGKALTASVRLLHANFTAAAEKVKALPYDVLDVESPQFELDVAGFQETVAGLDRSLAAVIVQAFDNCGTVAIAFKLMETFEGLLERDIIAADMESKHLQLLHNFRVELAEVSDIFHEQQSKPLVNKNAAPHSGAAMWVASLKDRIVGPMERVRGLGVRILSSEVGRNVVQAFERLIQELTDYQRRVLDDWCTLVSQTSDLKLKQPLLRQQQSGGLTLLYVNFDPGLVRLLREVRYFSHMANVPLDIPASALKIFERSEQFRQQIGNLDLICSIYNGIQHSLQAVEKPLVQHKLDAVDAALEKGLGVLNWNSHHIEDHISEVMTLVKDLSETLNTIKGNVRRTREILAEWSSRPLFERKESKVYCFEELQTAFKDSISVRHGQVSDGGRDIAKLLSNSNRILKTSKGAPAWRAYVDFVGDIVLEGIGHSIISSLDYLFNQVDPNVTAKGEVVPLVEVALELAAPEIVWSPQLGTRNAGGGLRSMFDSWILSFLDIGARVRRLDSGEGNYSKEVEEDIQVASAITKLQDALLDSEDRASAFRSLFLRFEHLWKVDLSSALQEFLDREGVVGESGLKEDPPLEKFEAEIARYRALLEEVQALPTSANIGYIRADALPIKQALTTWVTKWIYLYTHYLQNKVVRSMEELYYFMDNANGILDARIDDAEDVLDDSPAPAKGTEEEVVEEEKVPEKGEAMSLYAFMGCMRDIRKRSDRTEACFGP
eukprot:jgi/Botrbrau1/8993/Bobra.0148s0096.1